MSGDHPVLPPGQREDRRKKKREVKVLVPAQLQEGWLAFQNADERRRLAPIPEAWATLDEASLRALLAKADRIGEPKQRG